MVFRVIPMKKYESCPYCGGDLVVTTKGKADAKLKAAPKFRSKAEEKSFLKWANQEGLIYAEGSSDEIALIHQFRELQAQKSEVEE